MPFYLADEAARSDTFHAHDDASPSVLRSLRQQDHHRDRPSSSSSVNGLHQCKVGRPQKRRHTHTPNGSIPDCGCERVLGADDYRHGTPPLGYEGEEEQHQHLRYQFYDRQRERQARHEHSHSLDSLDMQLDLATPEGRDLRDHSPPPTGSRTPHSQRSASRSFSLWPDSIEAEAPPPALPDLSPRGIHIPSRTSSKPTPKRRKARPSDKRKASTSSSVFSGFDWPVRSPSSSYFGAGGAGDEYALISPSASYSAFPMDGPQPDDAVKLDPLAEDDSSSFDLNAPNEVADDTFSVEARADELFSRKHLETIFEDPVLLLKFTSFLSWSKPQSLPVLIYYLDAVKAIKAIEYANAIAEALEPISGCAFSDHPARPTVNSVLEEKASQAFEELVREDLPAYVAHVFVQVVAHNIHRRVAGTLPPHLREMSEGLAEVFCMSDPSRPDNPIVFASDEFHRTTQYGVNYALGRNCRFLQGPKTCLNGTQRLKLAIEAGKETNEVLLNYRRDGSPFMNLVMVAPLRDSRGKIRYFLGAQVDVTALVRDPTELEGLQRYLDRQESESDGEVPPPVPAKDEGDLSTNGAPRPAREPRDEFRELAEMFNSAELTTVKEHGGRMHLSHDHNPTSPTQSSPKSTKQNPKRENAPPFRRDLSEALSGHSRWQTASLHGSLDSLYQYYLLVRPHPTLRILFTSPSLRVPGIAQTAFMSHINASPRVLAELTAALAAGRGVTAKVRWLASPRPDTAGANSTTSTEGRNSVNSASDPTNGAANGAANGTANGSADDTANDSSKNGVPPLDKGKPRWIHCTPLSDTSGNVGVWMVVLVDEDGARNPTSSGTRKANVASSSRFRPAPPISTRSQRSITTTGAAATTNGAGEIPARRTSARAVPILTGRPSQDFNLTNPPPGTAAGDSAAAPTAVNGTTHAEKPADQPADLGPASPRAPSPPPRTNGTHATAPSPPPQEGARKGSLDALKYILGRGAGGGIRSGSSPAPNPADARNGETRGKEGREGAGGEAESRTGSRAGGGGQGVWPGAGMGSGVYGYSAVGDGGTAARPGSGRRSFSALRGFVTRGRKG